ncbi:MAG: CHASE2 domain-containing protein, partial [Candidatus Magasanikbacteria bacterium]|nr:CHASE2 domain-containing protein [Candidatus Magasanikbacteria bacterium]
MEDKVSLDIFWVLSKNNRNQIIISAVVSLVLAASLWGGFFGVWRDKLIDLLFTSKPASGDIVIVTIDESSIQSIGQWPWPRFVFGRAINNLSSAGVIGIDVNFKEPSGRGSADDESFARALQSSVAEVVLSSEVQPDGGLILPLEKFRAHSLQGF